MSIQGKQSPLKSRQSRSFTLLLAAVCIVLAVAVSMVCLTRDHDTFELFLRRSFSSASSLSASYDGQHLLFTGKLKSGDRISMWEIERNSSKYRLITGGNGDPTDPAYLPDGRIIYSDKLLLDIEGPHSFRALFSITPDGKDVRRLTFGYHIDSNPEILPDGRVVFTRSFHSSDPAQPPVQMTIHPDGTGVSRFISPLDREAAQISQGYTIADRRLLSARPTPPALPSVVDYTRSTGTLLCLNVYESRIPSISALPPGAIDRVRVSKIPVPHGMPEKPLSVSVLGDAPVMLDGSFFIEVPADTPLQLTLLGKDGRSLATLEKGIWVRPNENRGCIGCHEDPYIAPENRQPMAVKHLPVSFQAKL